MGLNDAVMGYYRERFGRFIQLAKDNRNYGRASAFYLRRAAMYRLRIIDRKRLLAIRNSGH